jgi:cytoskeletal protein RodZ
MAEIAEELCITQRYLRALEQNDLGSLPGTFFYKSFARQYAALLGVPERQIQPGLRVVTAEEREASPPGQNPSVRSAGSVAVRSSPAPVRELDPLVEASNLYFSDRRIGLSVGMLVAVLVGCSGVFAWWNRPKQPRAQAATPAVTSRTPPAQIVNVSANPPVDDMNHVVLNLSATEPTWIEITSDGKHIFSGTLQPSQTKTLSGLDMAKMKVGNAGGLEVLLNGKSIGPLGASGQVRQILFTPDNFQILEPPPPPAEPATTL